MIVPPLAGLGPEQQALARRRWEVLRPHVQDGVPLARAARDAQVPLRTAQCWLVGYRAGGLAALARPGRSDRGARRTPDELVRLIKGLALRRPRPSVATVARQAALAAAAHGWPAPSYSTVHAIVTDLDPQLATLAHDGPTAPSDRYVLGDPVRRRILELLAAANGHRVRSQQSSGRRLEFERTFDDPVEDVWSALTEPDRVARWIGTWTGDPATGTVELVMTEDEGATPRPVRILGREAPNRLVVEMPSPDGVWRLSVSLHSRGARTTLRFVQRLAEPYDASSVGPGWHYYLDRLGAVVAGTNPPDAWDDYYSALQEAYAIPA